MFETKVSQGLLGSFSFSANGDPEGGEGAVTAIVFYKATDTLTTETVISPAQSTVDAALGKVQVNEPASGQAAGEHCSPAADLVKSPNRWRP